MQALGVGRSTIREAARQLQALGVVETRKGSGSYLLRPISAATIHMPLSITATGLREALLQTLDIRRGLEAEASALAAIRHTADDLARMSERLVEMERVHRLNGTAGPEDLLFHLSIYDAAQNPLFRQLLEQMREAFERFFTKPFDRPISPVAPFRFTARCSTRSPRAIPASRGKRPSPFSTSSRRTSRTCRNDRCRRARPFLADRGP